VKPRQLIWGKLWAMVGLSFTQLAVLAAYSTLAYQASTKVLPISIDWSLVHIGIWQLALTAFFIVAGFIVMAALMVGIGAAMPTYREAQQASPIFIIFSILPIYFAMVLIADPSGTVARITSYVPFMSPLILTFRMSIGALPPLEQVIAILVSLAYLIGSMYLAFLLFEFGSLETSRKVSLKNVFRRNRA
jgi:ABC-2 type transport system permease protein